MAQYDLTPKIAPFLDRHLVIPLLDFLTAKNVYPAAMVAEQKVQLLQRTHLWDAYKDAFAIARDSEEIPTEIKNRRNEVADITKTLQRDMKVFTDNFVDVGDSDKIAELKANGQLEMPHLTQTYGITEKSLDALHRFAKVQFECGNYQVATEYLYYYRTFTHAWNHDYSAMWGMLAAEILLENWDSAQDDLQIIKEQLDKTSAPQLQARTWILHWSLFIFFNQTHGRDSIVEFFFDEKFLPTLQTTSPHLLRYLTVAVIANKKKHTHDYIKNLVTVIEQESSVYRDPLTEFVQALLVQYDFELAQEKLRECEVVMANDYFLQNSVEDFIENARLMMFEKYCRIHSVIDIGMVADKLGMDTEKAEIWMVNLVRQARIVAHIDTQGHQVIIDAPVPNLYQQVKEKNLTQSTQVLVDNLVSRNILSRR